jgi:hypothetical protein
MIPKGRSEKGFGNTVEGLFIDTIWAGILKRLGLEEYEYWSVSYRIRTVEECRKYHGSREAARLVVNRLIHKALEQAADPDALSLARRFVPNVRYDIYRAVARSIRARQLAEIFPVLALHIFAGPKTKQDLSLFIGAKRLIESGAKLRDIAALMDVPMAYRHVKPGAAHIALKLLDVVDEPRLLDAYLPASLPTMKKWLRSLVASKRGGSEFLAWVAKHAFQIGGKNSAEIYDIIRDTSDWARTSALAANGSHLSQGTEFEKLLIVRPFNPNMAVSTALALSKEWHEVISSSAIDEDAALPDPWCPGGSFDGYEILPIRSNKELYLEGKSMKHCVRSYEESIRAGRSYIYSIRENRQRVATIELERDANFVVRLGQIKGPCNGRPSADIRRAVNRWFASQKGFRFLSASEMHVFRDFRDSAGWDD